MHGHDFVERAVVTRVLPARTMNIATSNNLRFMGSLAEEPLHDSVIPSVELVQRFVVSCQLAVVLLPTAHCRLVTQPSSGDILAAREATQGIVASRECRRCAA